MPLDLRGRNAIVTGGAKGIGRAVVACLVDAGTRVTVLDLDTPATDELRRDFPQMDIHLCDVSDAGQVESTVALCCAGDRSIDILVNNAAYVYSAPLLDVFQGFQRHSVEEWERVIATDLSSVFYVTANVVQRMLLARTRGVIVNVSSIAAEGNPGQGAYAAAKAGVEALTKTWARELGAAGIRFTCIAPGFTETQTTRESVSDAVVKSIKARTPLGRFATAAEIADGIMFLISNEFNNGKILRLDGGLVI